MKINKNKKISIEEEKEDKIFEKYAFRFYVSIMLFLSYQYTLGKIYEDSIFGMILYLLSAFFLIQSTLRMCGIWRPKWEK